MVESLLNVKDSLALLTDIKLAGHCIFAGIMYVHFTATRKHRSESYILGPKMNSALRVLHSNKYFIKYS